MQATHTVHLSKVCLHFSTFLHKKIKAHHSCLPKNERRCSRHQDKDKKYIKGPYVLISELPSKYSTNTKTINRHQIPSSPPFEGPVNRVTKIQNDFQVCVFSLRRVRVESEPRSPSQVLLMEKKIYTFKLSLIFLSSATSQNLLDLSPFVTWVHLPPHLLHPAIRRDVAGFQKVLLVETESEADSLFASHLWFFMLHFVEMGKGKMGQI